MDRLVVKIACLLLLGGVLIGSLMDTAFSQSAGLPAGPDSTSTGPSTIATPKAVPVAVGKPTDLLGALLLGTLWQKNHPATTAATPARSYQRGSYYAPLAMEQPAPAE